MTAFFDDSGEPEPNSGRNFFALGMIVLPSKSIRPCTKAWQTRIWQRVGISPQVLARIKVEIKSSELYNLQDRLMKGNALKPEQQILYSLGLNTRQRVTNFINEIWDFVEKPPVPIKYLGSVVNKGINWNNYSGMKYQEWRLFKNQGNLRAKQARLLSAELSTDVVAKSFKYLLQRLEYLGDQDDFKFDDAMVIGDEGTHQHAMSVIQAEAETNTVEYTNLPKIVTNVTWGSSLFNPCLQISDWVAGAIRMWAEGIPEGNVRLKQILPNFRGYPTNVMGRGIVGIPNSNYVPALP